MSRNISIELNEKIRQEIEFDNKQILYQKGKLKEKVIEKVAELLDEPQIEIDKKYLIMDKRYNHRGKGGWTDNPKSICYEKALEEIQNSWDKAIEKCCEIKFRSRDYLKKGLKSNSEEERKVVIGYLKYVQCEFIKLGDKIYASCQKLREEQEIFL